MAIHNFDVYVRPRRRQRIKPETKKGTIPTVVAIAAPRTLLNPDIFRTSTRADVPPGRVRASLDRIHPDIKRTRNRPLSYLHSRSY
ncbi:hypothetical protein MCOR25_010082, partial [Pyricularia grisea]